MSQAVNQVTALLELLVEEVNQFGQFSGVYYRVTILNKVAQLVEENKALRHHLTSVLDAGTTEEVHYGLGSYYETTTEAKAFHMRKILVTYGYIGHTEDVFEDTWLALCEVAVRLARLFGKE